MIRSGCSGHKVNGWMNWADFLHAHTWCQKSYESYFEYAHGCDLLGPWTLKSAFLKNKSMNWADFWHVGGGVIIFG